MHKTDLVCVARVAEYLIRRQRLLLQAMTILGLVYVAPCGYAQQFQQVGLGAISRSVQDKLSDTVNVKDFGAKCDGNYDDSTAFQAAHDSARYGLTIQIPPGVCFLGKNINVSNHNMKWIGSGQGATYLTMGPAVSKLFNVTNGTSTQLFAPEFRDFVVDGSRSPNGVAFYFNSVRSVNIERVYTVNCYQSYFFDSTTYGTTNTVHMSSLFIESTPDVPGARGIMINGGGDDWFVSNSRILQSVQSKSNVGLEVTSAGGLVFNNLDISQLGRAMVIDPPAGKYVHFGQFNAVQCDTSWGDNLTLDGSAAFASGYPFGLYGLTFVNSWFSSAGTSGGNGHGVNVIGAKTITITASQIYGNSLNGIRLDSFSQNIIISNNQISGNSNGYGNAQMNKGQYSGIQVDDSASHFSLTDNTSGQQSVFANTQKYGIAIGLNATSYRVIGNDLMNNVIGALNDLSHSTTSQVGLNLPPSVIQ